MFLSKKNAILILFTLLFHLGFSQNIALKLPIQNASYTTNQNNITFLWENNTSSSWEIDVADNPSFLSATNYTSATESFSVNISTLSSQVYYWRIRSASDTSETRQFTVFSLASLGTLVYHINAQNGIVSSSGNVSQWNNLASTQFNATQNNAFFQPELISNSLNGYDLVKFGGSNGSITSNLSLNNFLIADTSFTFLAAYKQETRNSPLSYLIGSGNPNVGGAFSGGNTGGGRNFGLVSSTNGVNSSVRVPGIIPLDWRVRSGFYNSLFQNTNQESTIGSGVDKLQFNTIGLRPDVPTLNFHGYLGDILIYNEILPDSSRLLVENYLRTKYTPFPDLGKDTVVCGPAIKIGFRADNGYSSKIWSTGNTNVDSINITQNGTYWLTVESFGITLTDTIEISGIVPKPSLSFSSDTTICFADSLEVSYNVQAGFTPLWSSRENTNSINIQDSSSLVYLVHTDVNNCSASSDSFFVKVDSLELLSTIGDDRNLCDGGQIFAESEGEGPFSYLWNTGDTTAFTTPPTLGAQNISVALSNFNNCVFRDTISVNAVNLPAPNVAFSVDTVCPNSLAQLNDLSSPGGTDNITSWQWVFNNADTTFAQNPDYSFPAGASTINLTIETDSGCVNTLIQNYNTHRQANAQINDVITCAEVATNLTNNSSIAIPDFITDYEWFIGNQSYSGASPSVVFPSSGQQEVVLLVTTNQNCTDTTQRVFDINPALSPDFTSENTCIGDSTVFTDITASLSTISRLWDFGTGAALSSDTMPKVLYPDTGNYTVSLTIENALGCRNTSTKNIRIASLPKAIVGIDNLCENSLTLFYDSSQTEAAGLSAQEWTINGNTYTSDSVLLSFDTAKNYSLAYQIVDAFSCEADTTFNFRIFPKPSVNFNFNPTFGESPLLVEFTNTTDSATFYSWNFGDNNEQSSAINPSFTYEENGSYAISLTAENQFGCIDSTQKNLVVAPTDLDVEITDVSYTITNLPNGDIAYTPSFTITNVGTRVVINASLYAALDNDKSIAEIWTGALRVGQSFVYTFSSSIIVSDETLLSYLCGEITNVNNDTETLLDNNKSCTIINGKLQTSFVYPNPSKGNAFIDIISKEDGEVALSIYDLAGAKINAQNNIAIREGYNQVLIDAIRLQAGVYYLIVEHEGESYKHQLIVSNQ